MPSIVLDQISKSYLLRAGFVDRIGQAMSTMRAGRIHRLGRRLTQRAHGRRVTALHPVSATIEAGESVAILGRNGSGKSTLLSLIADVLSPTEGACRINGRVAAILELGAGFHPDFSGRDNLRHKAALQEIPRAVLNEKMDDILAFADIGEYIDEPVSTYSTGMQMRLAFAINTVLDPDILIVDEALSVGDTFFQARCIRWIEDFIARGRIFLCVSHDIFTVRKLCHRGLVLENGRLLCDAPIGEAANTYYEVHRGIQDADMPKTSGSANSEATATPGPSSAAGDWTSVSLTPELRTGNRDVELVSVETRPALGSAFEVGDTIEVRLAMKANNDVGNHHYGFGLRDKRGLLYGGFHTYYLDEPPQPLFAGDFVEVRFKLTLAVPPGEYLVLVGVSENMSDIDWADFDVCWDTAEVTVIGASKFWGLGSLPFDGLEIARQSAAESPTS